MTRRIDVAIAAIGEVRPNLPGADRYAIAQAVLAAVDIHDMHVEMAQAARRPRNEYAAALAVKIRQSPPDGEVIHP